MRVIQLIDSLRSGGAERMAVNYANALAKRIDESYLCCTRMEGLLKKKLSPEVGYLFLDKKKTLDIKAFRKLRRFVKEHKIDLIQAHSSSWFLALMIKWSLPRVKLIWHDHYGRELQGRKVGILKYASKNFDGILSVNSELLEWSKKNLRSKKIAYFRNFLLNDQRIPEDIDYKNFIHGSVFNIICLANLRPQKDHLNLLKAFKIVSENHAKTSLHLVGKDENDEYSKSIRDFIASNALEEKVFIYGEQEKVEFFLGQADLGILSSVSEGLPLALLEYGRAGLPVVSTKVGQCEEILREKGLLAPPGDSLKLAECICHYIEKEESRKSDAASFKRYVKEEFSEEVVMSSYITYFNQ
ncbi:glycosyltransferase [Salinimicrobium sp. TH3]|uniref:glycosyltransferase n=1 Tax=Salinimicrobium sp. TH3 TaxID=2997342 RepID=UPI002276EF82|nr:glycosyltransferase [Salinimicrobium sp. TH3]MCY2687873.1 glycosyltransferase [Salinimicrobium sp. TH3]